MQAESQTGSGAAAPWWLLAGAALVRLAMLFITDGMAHPDEIFQSIEPAYHLAFGTGALAWEWDTGLRTWLVPWLYAPIFRVLDLLGLSDPGTFVRAAQVICVIFSIIAVDAAHRIAFLLRGEKAARLAATLTAVFPLLLYYSPRTLNDGPSAAFLLAGYAAFLQLTRDTENATRHAFISGIWAGLSFIFRFTAPLFFIGPGLWLLIKRQWRKALTMALGFLLLFTLIGLMDWATWGTPFKSLYEYFLFNVIEGKSRNYGVEPTEWYAQIVHRELGWLALAVIIVAIRGAKGLGAIGFGFLVGLLMLALPEHKEERFLLPFWIFLPTLVALGTTEISNSLERFRGTVAALLAVILLIPHSIVWMEKDWAPRQELFSTLRAAANQPDVRGILIETDLLTTGGFVSIQKDIPFTTLNNKINDQNSTKLIDHELFNYIVVKTSSETLVRRALRNRRFENFMRVKDMLVLRKL